MLNCRCSKIKDCHKWKLQEVTFIMMVCIWPLINVRVGCDIWKQGWERCKMRHGGWGFQFYEGFFLHKCAVIAIYYGNNDDNCYILVHSNIVHGKHKSISTKEHLVITTWLTIKGKVTKQYNKVRYIFAFLLIKQFLLRHIYINGRWIPKWPCVKCEMKWKTTEIYGCKCSYGGISSSFSQKI
jgi:hypothetical protein